MECVDSSSFLLWLNWPEKHSALSLTFLNHQDMQHMGLKEGILGHCLQMLSLPCCCFTWSVLWTEAFMPAFGMTPSTCSWALNAMLKIMVRQMCNNQTSNVMFPLPEKMQQFAEMMSNCKPTINDTLVLWMVAPLHQSVQLSRWHRMLSIGGMIAIQCV